MSPSLQEDSLPSEPPGKPKVKVKVLVAHSCQLSATPSAVAHQAPLFMEFSRQEYWNG